MNRNVRRNLAWAVGGGAALGAGIAVLTAPILLLRGFDVPAPVLLMFPVAGVAGGVVVGLLRPWITDVRRAMLVGAITGPVAAATMVPFVRWADPVVADDMWVGFPLYGALLGTIVARSWWKKLR